MKNMRRKRRHDKILLMRETLKTGFRRFGLNKTNGKMVMEKSNRGYDFPEPVDYQSKTRQKNETNRTECKIEKRPLDQNGDCRICKIQTQVVYFCSKCEHSICVLCYDHGYDAHRQFMKT